MEWQQIIGFYHVTKLGGFTKAAEATFRTQSAISQQIKNLENEFGCQLLERIGKKKFRLTIAGEKFFKFSESILKQYNSFTEEIDEIKGLQMGHLRMAAPFTTLYHLFPRLLKSYNKQFPNVELTILDRSQQDILNLLKNGDIDLGLVLESNVKKDLTALRWKKVRSVVMTPIGHPLGKVKKVTLKQIAKYPLILPPKNIRSRKYLEERFQKVGADYHILMESSNVELSSLYVEMGFGISLATVVKDLPELKKRKLAFLPMDHLIRPDYLTVITRKDTRMISYKNAFIKVLFEENSF